MHFREFPCFEGGESQSREAVWNWNWFYFEIVFGMSQKSTWKSQCESSPVYQEPSRPVPPSALPNIRRTCHSPSGSTPAPPSCSRHPSLSAPPSTLSESDPKIRDARERRATPARLFSGATTRRCCSSPSSSRTPCRGSSCRWRWRARRSERFCRSWRIWSTAGGRSCRARSPLLLRRTCCTRSRSCRSLTGNTLHSSNPERKYKFLFYFMTTLFDLKRFFIF